MKVVSNGKNLCVYVKKRPGVELFLTEMAKHYEIVVYTASQSIYATPILNQLDPGNHIHHHLFRESCIVTNGGFIKDLSRLGRDLAGVIIVDNSPACYALQPENGIPISTWTEDPNDLMLSQLAPFLKLLATVDDVREYLMWLITDDNIDYIDALSELKASLENKSEDSILDTNHNEEPIKSSTPIRKESGNMGGKSIEVSQVPAVSKPSCHLRNGSCNFDTNKKFATLAMPCLINGTKIKRLKVPAKGIETLQMAASTKNSKQIKPKLPSKAPTIKTEVSTPRNRLTNENKVNPLTQLDPKKYTQLAFRNTEAIEKHIRKIKSKVTSPKGSKVMTSRLSLNNNGNESYNAPLHTDRARIKLDLSSTENRIVSINLTKSNTKKPLTARRENRTNLPREIAMKCIPREVVNISRGYINTKSTRSLKKIVTLKVSAPTSHSAQKKALTSRKHMVAVPKLII
jgi:Dullard-like phosphatase family protein